MFAPPGIHAETIECKVDVTELMGNEIFLYLVSGKNSFVFVPDKEPDLIMGTMHGPGYSGALGKTKWNRRKYNIADDFHTYASE